MANSHAAIFNTVIRHSDDGGARDDKESCWMSGLVRRRGYLCRDDAVWRYSNLE
jgi:hypothetical protein